MPSPPHEHRVRVRYAETDQMGVVYHANYLVFMEEGRTRLMESLGFRYADLERQGMGLAVHHVEVDYRAPALYDEEVVVQTTVERVRSASVRFRYELIRATDGTRLANGLTDLACLKLNGEERSVRPLPDTVREALLAHLSA
ncbi:MAG: thioesterase family protein [Planctomycetota bacterium]